MNNTDKQLQTVYIPFDKESETVLSYSGKKIENVYIFTHEELEALKSNEQLELANLFNDVSKTFKEIFPKSGAVEHLIKLQHEAKEAENAPDDVTEYADCLLGILGASSKADISLEELIKVSFQKLQICKSRKWDLLADGTYQHIPQSLKE